MGVYLGFVSLGSTLVGTHLVRSGNTPINADSLPTFRVYGPAGLMTGGTGSMSLKDTGTVTGATNATPIVITSADHNLSTGTRVTISGVGGNTAANGSFQTTNVSSSTFSLDGSAGNGTYTSGGTWNVSGLYAFSVVASAANGYEAGKTYVIVGTAVVSGTTVAELLTFTVV